MGQAVSVGAARGTQTGQMAATIQFIWILGSFKTHLNFGAFNDRFAEGDLHRTLSPTQSAALRSGHFPVHLSLSIGLS